MIENIIFRPIRSSDKFNRFSLENENHTPLKTFLKKDAISFHLSNIAKTYVMVMEGEYIIAYISLMASEIKLNQNQKPQEPIGCKRYESFPAIKIIRLAIAKKFQRFGIGERLIKWSISLTIDKIMQNIGCRFIIVDSKKESIKFYEKNGFILLNSQENLDDPHPVMFLDLNTIRVYFEEKNESKELQTEV